MGELFRDAVRLNASRVILVHNHPSGDPTPSPDDLHLTAEALAAGRLLDIDVLDPAFAPGTGTPEPGGFSSIDLLRAETLLAQQACQTRHDRPCAAHRRMHTPGPLERVNQGISGCDRKRIPTDQ